MKKLIFAACILFAACQDSPNKYDIIEVDGCEYVAKNLNSMNAVFTHKGNCKFCAQRKQ